MAAGQEAARPDSSEADPAEVARGLQALLDAIGAETVEAKQSERAYIAGALNVLARLSTQVDGP